MAALKLGKGFRFSTNVRLLANFRLETTCDLSQLSANASGKSVHRSPIGVVGRVGEELIVEAEAGPSLDEGRTRRSLPRVESEP